jgi:hypothetical protein
VKTFILASVVDIVTTSNERKMKMVDLIDGKKIHLLGKERIIAAFDVKTAEAVVKPRAVRKVHEM